MTATRLAHEQREQQNLLVAQAVVGGPEYQVIPWTVELATEHFDQFNRARRQQHRTHFPLTDNMLALIFVTLADLSQDQRNTLTSIMTHRNRQLSEYRITELRDLFMEMFYTTRTAVDNPLMQPSNAAQRRSFLVTDEGELEGTDGYWAEDEEDGAEGFLEANEDVFWIYDDENYSWFQRRFQKKGSSEEKEKVSQEKEKEKAVVAGDSFAQGKEKEKEKDEKENPTWWAMKITKIQIGTMKKRHGMIGKKKNPGMMAIWPNRICTTLMSTVTSRGKEKEKEGKVKEKEKKKAKESLEMEKENQIMCNRRTIPHHQFFQPLSKHTLPQQHHRVLAHMCSC